MRSGRRVLGAVFPELHLELSGGVRSGEPVAVVIARIAASARSGGRLGPSERAVTGGTRLDVVSPGAREAGIHPGMTVAQARARRRDLAVRVVEEGVARAALERLAELAFSLGTTVSCEDGAILVDITGCAGAFQPASDLPAGEAGLAARFVEHARTCGHAVHVAIADGPRIARALAAEAAALGRTDPWIVSPGQGARAMASLPISRLPLAQAEISWLAKLGLARVRDLAALQESALGLRLTASRREVLSLLRGEDTAPLVPWTPPAVLVEAIEIDHAVSTLDPLVFVAKTLTARLAERLRSRGLAVTSLRMTFGLDVSFACEVRRSELLLELPAPVQDPDALLRIVRTKLEGGGHLGPVSSFEIATVKVVPHASKELGLFEPETDRERALARVLLTLTVELGESAVGKLALADTWRQEARSVLLPIRAASTKEALGVPDKPHPGVIEPALLLEEPIPVSRQKLTNVCFARRLEANAWWTGASSSSSDHVVATLDGRVAYVTLERPSSDAPAGPSKATLLGWLD